MCSATLGAAVVPSATRSVSSAFFSSASQRATSVRPSRKSSTERSRSTLSRSSSSTTALRRSSEFSKEFDLFSVIRSFAFDARAEGSAGEFGFDYRTGRRIRRIADFIAGMTDRYAVACFDKSFVPRGVRGASIG